MSRPPRQNNEAEFDAFCAVCDRLGGFDHRTTPEWADGYLTALATGARGVPFEGWIAQLAGDAFERAFADPEDRAAAARALHARVAVLHDQLDAETLSDDPEHLRLAPLMLPWTDDDRARAVEEGTASVEQASQLVTGAEWADGFFGAVEAFASEWPAAMADEDDGFAAGLLSQIHALLLPEGSDELRAHIETTYGAAGADRERLVDEACFAIQDLRLWVVDNAPRPETRRVEKAPGRNDPCPCGSGKKFKKCHGAA